MADIGPYDTERQASATPAVASARAAWEADRVPGHHIPHHLKIMTDACDDAGVTIGEFDRRILTWIANYEPFSCQVIAGLIARACEARKAAVPEGAVTEWAVRFTGPDNRLLTRVVFTSPALFPDEAETFARNSAKTVNAGQGGVTAAIETRTVTPWKDAPDA